MWVPYLLSEPWKPESPADQVHISLADDRERDFLVGFFLKNPVTNAWEVDLQLDGSRTEELADATQPPIVMGFYAAEAGRLNEIVCKTRAENPRAALVHCYNHTSRLLDLWSVFLGRGLGIAGFRVADLEHGAKWRSVPFRPSALSFTMPDCSDATDEHAALAWLYREARNAQSPAYRFLCSHKILEAWSKRLGAFGRTDRIIAEKELPLERPQRSVTREMAVLSGVMDPHPEFEGVPFDRLVSLLAPWRERVTSVLVDPEVAARSDQYETHVELTALANLADFAARQVLLDELELWGRVDRPDDPATDTVDLDPESEMNGRGRAPASEMVAASRLGSEAGSLSPKGA
jgi:hypothetical protein